MNDRLDDAIRAAAADIVAAAPTPPSTPVTAALRRRKVPFWAMGALALMPVFGFIYVRALTEGTVAEQGPLSQGAGVYSRCASCHGGTGGGVEGLGYQFSNGEVLATFANIEDQIRYVYYGTDQYKLADVEIYGDPNRDGGPHVTGARGNMPMFSGELSLDEIVAVVCHERYTLGGADPTDDSYIDEYNAWCATDAPVYSAIAAGDVDLIDTQDPTIEIENVAVTPIGPAPIPGQGR